MWMERIVSQLFPSAPSAPNARASFGVYRNHRIHRTHPGPPFKARLLHNKNCDYSATRTVSITPQQEKRLLRIKSSFVYSTTETRGGRTSTPPTGTFLSQRRHLFWSWTSRANSTESWKNSSRLTPCSSSAAPLDCSIPAPPLANGPIFQDKMDQEKEREQTQKEKKLLRLAVGAAIPIIACSSTSYCCVSTRPE